MGKLIRIICVICFTTLLSGCAGDEKGVERKAPQTAIIIEDGSGNDFDIEFYNMDSCQYIGYLKGTNHDWAAHKGNCKFCRERRKQEIKEAIKEYFEGH